MELDQFIIMRHNYNDYAAFFSLAVLIAFLIWIGDSLIILIKNKLIDWE